jgi:hypothetical protein
MALDCELYSIGGNAGGMGMALGRCIAALYYRLHYLYQSARIKKRGFFGLCPVFNLFLMDYRHREAIP